VAPRDQARIPWPGVFAKAYALVAVGSPPLRRVYVKLPWPHDSGEKALFLGRLKAPDTATLRPRTRYPCPRAGSISAERHSSAFNGPCGQSRHCSYYELSGTRQSPLAGFRRPSRLEPAPRHAVVARAQLVRRCPG
jgi:hypothetical protein